MLGIHDFGLFVTAGVLLNLTPGQDTFYILGRSLGGGTRIGVVSVFGIATGSLIHTIAAALGLSTLLSTSQTAFTLVKLAGAAYLVYLGARLLLRSSKMSIPLSPMIEPQDPLAAYRQGVLSKYSIRRWRSFSLRSFRSSSMRIHRTRLQRS